MKTDSELGQFANVCTIISNEVADDRGFIPVRELLHRFHAKLILRPLLVEGMLISNDRALAKNEDSYRWTVLLDSERYGISDNDLAEESWGKPLSSQFRYTVAHELIHSIAFFPTEYGVKLQTTNTKEKSREKFVADIEEQVDYLSPLLLWSNNAISAFISNRSRSVSLRDLLDVSMKLGISRFTLIERLRLFKDYCPDEIEKHHGLRNIAVGIGKWVDSRTAVFSKRPIFINFDRQVRPQFLVKIAREDNLPANALIKDNRFMPCGGILPAVNFETEASLPDGVLTEKMNVEFSIENNLKEKGAPFLYTVRKIAEYRDSISDSD